MYQRRFRLDIRKNFCLSESGQALEWLPREMVELPPLAGAQCKAIPSHPIAVTWENRLTPLGTNSFYEVVESNKVFPEPPLLQTAQSQLPQLLLIRLVLQTPHSFVALLWTHSRASVSFLQ